MKNRILGEPIVNQIFNMSVNEARKHLEDHGYSMRIISEDNKSKWVDTMDYDGKRVNVFVMNGKIDDINNLS